MRRSEQYPQNRSSSPSSFRANLNSSSKSSFSTFNTSKKKFKNKSEEEQETHSPENSEELFSNIRLKFNFYRRYETNIFTAIKNGDEESVNYLIKSEINLDDLLDGKTPLYFAAENSQENIFNLLLSNGADVNFQNDQNSTMLHLAVQSFQSQVLYYVLNKNNNLLFVENNQKCTPIHLAAKINNEEAIQIFLRYGYDANESNCENFTPLHFAAENGNCDIISLLIKENAEIDCKNDSGKTPLHLAAIANQAKVIEQLLKEDVNQNLLNNENHTAFHCAIINNNLDATKVFIKLTDINQQIKYGFNRKIKYGFSPLHHAAKQGRADIINLLLENNAMVDLEAWSDETPLFIAIANNNTDAVRILLNAGANIHHRNSSEDTPLHIAASTGNLIAIKILLDNNANPDLTNNHAETPYQIAVENGDKKAVRLLRNYNHESKEIPSKSARYSTFQAPPPSDYFTAEKKYNNSSRASFNEKKNSPKPSVKIFEEEEIRFPPQPSMPPINSNVPAREKFAQNRNMKSYFSEKKEEKNNDVIADIYEKLEENTRETKKNTRDIKEVKIETKEIARDIREIYSLLEIRFSELEEIKKIIDKDLNFQNDVNRIIQQPKAAVFYSTILRILNSKYLAAISANSNIFDISISNGVNIVSKFLKLLGSISHFQVFDIIVSGIEHVDQNLSKARIFNNIDDPDAYKNLKFNSTLARYITLGFFNEIIKMDDTKPIYSDAKNIFISFDPNDTQLKKFAKEKSSKIREAKNSYSPEEINLFTEDERILSICQIVFGTKDVSSTLEKVNEGRGKLNKNIHSMNLAPPPRPLPYTSNRNTQQSSNNTPLPKQKKDEFFTKSAGFTLATAQVTEPMQIQERPDPTPSRRANCCILL